MSGKGQHVYPSGGHWSVRRSDALRASGNYRTRGEAVAAGHDLAERQRSILYIHDKDGLIHERHAYGGDPGGAKGAS